MADNANSGDETSTNFSKEELQSMIEAVVTKIVPQIVGKSINGAFQDRSTKFEESLLEKVRQQMNVKEDVVPVKGKKSVDPEFLGLQEEMKALRAEKDAEKSQFRDKELRRMVSEELEFHGVDKGKRKALLAQLVLDEKLIGYSENDPDTVVFNSKMGPLPLRQGLQKEYFMSEEGKGWLPPKNIQGSGSKPARVAVPEVDQYNQAANALKKLF